MIISITNCKSLKQDYSCTAEEMYSKSYVFRAQKDFFKSTNQKYYILSAKYGLINSWSKLTPYNESVMVEGQTHHKTTHTGSWSKSTQKEWAKKVSLQLNRLLSKEWVTEIHFHVTGTYWGPIKKQFQNHPKVVYIKQQMNPPTQQKQYIFSTKKIQNGEDLYNTIDFLSTLVKGEEEFPKLFFHPTLSPKGIGPFKTAGVKKLYPELDMGGLHRVSMSRSKQHKGWVIHKELLPFLYQLESGGWRVKRDHPPIKINKQISYKDL